MVLYELYYIRLLKFISKLVHLYMYNTYLHVQTCAREYSSSDVFGPFPPFPEDAMISRHFQNEAKLTLLQWGVFLDIKNIPAPADSGEER